jgi:5-hydroxyisourate hydrolase-like protein (transthyretin family)
MNDHMKLKTLLLSFFFITSCLNSNASVIMPGETGKGISEVSGNILDADTKKPLKEVTITAYLDSKKEKYVITDELGKFDFDELKSGTYKLVFEKDGYKKITKEKVTVKTDETFQMRIEMIEIQDFDLMPSVKYFFDSK